MSNTFLDIHIALPPDEQIREILPGVIADLGFDGFVEDDRGIHCYIKKELWMSTMDSAIRDLTDQLNLPMIEIVSIVEIENRNWNEEWEKSIRPIAISDTIVVTPSWHPMDGDGKLVLVIDPKMTFGTGYHETTRLVLRMMESSVPRNGTVLDVGTGTGILAIAAVKLGARNALAVDTDEWALDNGRENIRRNDVDGRVEIRIGSLETVHERNFDLIVANIVRNTLLDLMPAMAERLSPRGTLILSGLMESDRDVIESSITRSGLHIAGDLRENEWIALAARKV